VHKKIAWVMGLVVGAAVLTFLTPGEKTYNIESKPLTTEGIIDQQYVQEGKETEILSIYYKDQLLGIVHDIDEYEAFLDRIYAEKYAKDFPESEIGLGGDIHMSTSLSSLHIDDKDEEIFTYLEENNLFSIKGYKIEFSNGSICYVKNSEDFIKAKEDFVLNYLENKGVNPQDTKNKLDTAQATAFSDENAKDIAYKYLDTAQISNELVPIDLILKSYDECITWLSFGYSYEPDYYVVEEGDMIQGVAQKNGVSVMNLLSINSEKLKSENQLLQVGDELNVTEIDSPIGIEVTKIRVTSEKIYPEDTKYIYDNTMREGQRYTKQKYKVGSARVQYQETYVNGELDESKTKEVSRLQVSAPQQEIVVIGTMVIPNIGSGRFRLPTNNSQITCGWYCYAGHRALDVIDRYNRYGPALAADRGVIESAGYTAYTGYYAVINHNNGFWTYYGHFNKPCYWPVGATVKKGEVIGQIGMTGRATGPHVHFEIRKGCRSSSCRVYPWDYIG